MIDNLSPDNAQYIDEAVSRGAYPTERQALDEAVDLLRRRDQLRADVQVGIDQADRGELIPAEEVFARLEARAKSIEKSSRNES